MFTIAVFTPCAFVITAVRAIRSGRRDTVGAFAVSQINALVQFFVEGKTVFAVLAVNVAVLLAMGSYCAVTIGTLAFFCLALVPYWVQTQTTYGLFTFITVQRITFCARRALVVTMFWTTSAAKTIPVQTRALLSSTPIICAPFVSKFIFCGRAFNVCWLSRFFCSFAGCCCLRRSGGGSCGGGGCCGGECQEYTR